MCMFIFWFIGFICLTKFRTGRFLQLGLNKCFFLFFGLRTMFWVLKSLQSTPNYVVIIRPLKLFITGLSATSKTLMKITLNLTHIHSSLDFGNGGTVCLRMQMHSELWRWAQDRRLTQIQGKARSGRHSGHSSMNVQCTEKNRWRWTQGGPLLSTGSVMC